MILELKNGSKFTTELFLDNKSVFDLVEFNIKRDLFDKVLSKIDEEISTVANLSKNENEGLYLWCLTYDIHRADGIIGIVLDYYLIELIKHLEARNTTLREIKLCKPVTKSFKVLLNKETNLEIINNSSIKDEFKLYLRYKIGPLRSVFGKVVSSFKYRNLEIKKLPVNTVIILKAIHKPYTRYKGFPDELAKRFNNTYVLDTSLFAVKNYDNGEEISINPFKAIVFFKAFKETCKFYNYKTKFLKKNKSNIGAFSEYIRSQSFLQSYSVKLNKNAYQQVFNNLEPSCLVVSSTFGDPQKRMPLIIAKENGIKTILFSCRPFLTNMRSEDRLISPDLLQYHNSTIGDQIIIFDKPTFHHLIRSGIEKGKIKFYRSQSDNLKLIGTKLYSNCLLLLFAHHSYNEDIIDLFYTLKINGSSIDKLIYREHPNVKLTANQVIKLQTICPNLISISDKFWHEINFENVLAFSSNSTSGIDALSRGASLLWLPFLTGHSLQFAEMMDLLCYTAVNQNDFFRFVKNYLINSNFASEIDFKCNNDFLTNILIDSNQDLYN